MMKTPVVKILYVSWRNGQPRFEPGPRQQRLGMKGYNLRHPDGRWFTFEEATAESLRLAQETERRTAAAGSAGPHQPPPAFHAPQLGPTLCSLVEALWDMDEFRSIQQVDRKRVTRGLSRKTVEGYRKSARAVELACARLAAARSAPTLWDVPATLITASVAQGLINEIHAHSGLATARATRAFLSQLWARSRTRHTGLALNVWQQLERLPAAQGRIRPWEPAEFWHMVQVADAMGRPELGDSFMLGVLHGHRQGDRLQLTGMHGLGAARSTTITATHITITQSKTGRAVTLKLDGHLRHRLEAALLRRQALKVQYPHMLLDETAASPWNPAGDHYRHVFAEVRAKAAEAMPSCATLRDQDLRDTNQTWLDRASVDPELMALVAGHSVRTTHTAIQRRHYVAFNQQRADAAVDLLSAYITSHAPRTAQEGEA